MELDLDAFLQSSDTSGDEDHHHLGSTVDELLLIDSDDSSPPSSPLSHLDASSSQSNSNRFDVTSSRLTSQLTDRDRPTASRINSGDNFNVSRQLPPLFTAVRSSAKPGAALAAAAAASRLIPTPHAAAIKLTREKSSVVPKANIGHETGTGSEYFSHPDAKLEDDALKLDFLETPPVELTELHGEHESKNGWSLTVEQLPGEEVGISERDGFDLDFGDDMHNSVAKPEVGSPLILDEDGTGFVLSDNSTEHIEGGYTESGPVITLDSTEGVIPFLPGQGMDAKAVKEDDSISVLSEKTDTESIKFHDKDTEYGLQAEEVDKPTGTDVSVDMGGIVIHHESVENGERMQGTSLNPLQIAEELEKKHAFTGLHWEEGAAAQPMKLEGVHMGSTTLAYFNTSADNTITRTISSPAFRRDHGTPQALAVHLNYIAVGMSRGLIVVFPSKYSPHYADNLDAKMLMLGLQGDRSYAPVTSMSFNQQGDLLFAGYDDGHYTVWDVQRVSAAKVITEHKSPVVHMLYLGMDSQVTRQFNVVSGDSKGVVKLNRFSPFSWLSRFSISKTSTLLDESTSTVVCASSLLREESAGGSSSFANTTTSTSGIESATGGDSYFAEEGVVIFVTHQSALVAKVISNTPEVYSKLPRPDGVREGSMPYAAWKYIAPSQSFTTDNGHVRESETVSLLAIAWDNQVQVAKLVKSELKIYAKWTLDGSAIGIAWLDDQMLVVLTSAGQLCLYANDGKLIHDTSFAVDGSRGDDVIGYHTHFSNVSGKSHHNCIGVRGASLYLLGPTHLVVSRLLPWKERIEVLRRGGDWMGAFNMAMMLYDGQAHGVFDLPRALNDVRKVIMPYLVELLLAYVDEVFSYIAVALGNQVEHLNDSKADSYSVASEQYTRVGGVAVEFCVHIKRTDILFDEVLSRFETVQQKDTFLELLEPYILKDMLGSLPPEIMQSLVEHYSTKGWLQRVEQCVLHMDISSLDFNQVVRLCREHNLYRALIYLFNKGLDDFRTPLEELLLVFTNNHSENTPSLGYRMLVYLKYCFSGFAFPPGHGALSPARLPSLRRELIHFLLEDSNAPSSWGSANLSAIKSYKNLYHLLELDTEATLDVLRCAFVHEVPKSESDHESAIETDPTSQSHDLTQKIVDVLALVPEASKFMSILTTEPDTVWPSKDDISHILEFISHFVSRGEAKVSKELLGHIFEYLTSNASIPADVERKGVNSCKVREKEILALLEVVPQTDWDDRHLLDMCEKVHFYQVCGFIHNSRGEYIAAIDSFMKDKDEPIHLFLYIHNLLRRKSDKTLDSLGTEVISRIPDLVLLNREGTFFLVVEHFLQEFQQILAELRSHPKSLFLYLKTVIEAHSVGTVNFSSLRKGEPICSTGTRVKNQVDDFLERVSELPRFLRENPIHVTDEITELYLKLLCQYEPNSVLHFLETCESYRVDHCLRLCQEYEIIDAAAFLLERVGDVGSALSYTLSDLAVKFSMLDAAVQSVFDYSAVDHINEVMKKKEVNDILHIVHTCVGLCQRNSSRLDPNESEALWFQLLDIFCEPLTNPSASKMDSEHKDKNNISSELYKAKWKIRGQDKGALILRRLFSIFIKEIVEGMIGYVRLPTVMMKLLSNNGSQEFGDFKATILGTLGTYDFERRILDTARCLIEDDTYYTMTLLKRGASHGHGPRSLVCFICNSPVTKDSTGIRVYNCGHASHLYCEPTSHTGCPICMPKKKGGRSGGNFDNGLVSKGTRPKHKGGLSQGRGVVHQEKDPVDRQISRYEILSNLDKDNNNKRMVQVVDNLAQSQLRLAPPAVYQEKVKAMTTSSTSSAKTTKAGKQNKDVKAAVRFPLKSNIFGKEKTSRR